MLQSTQTSIKLKFITSTAHKSSNYQHSFNFQPQHKISSSILIPTTSISQQHVPDQ